MPWGATMPRGSRASPTGPSPVGRSGSARARRALRDAVVRYNAEGLAGLHDRPKPGRPQRLSEAEQAALAARVFRGPDPGRDGVAAWTRADLGAWRGARVGGG